MFSNIGFRHDLNARNKPAVQLDGKVRLVHQHPINAIAQARAFGHGFDMDVARPLFDRVTDEVIYLLNNRILFEFRANGALGDRRVFEAAEIFDVRPDRVLRADSEAGVLVE
jgi:hypothetical protein